MLSLLKTSLKYWIEVKACSELFYFHSLVCLVFNKIDPHVTILGVCNLEVNHNLTIWLLIKNVLKPCRGTVNPLSSTFKGGLNREGGLI